MTDIKNVKWRSVDESLTPGEKVSLKNRLTKSENGCFPCFVSREWEKFYKFLWEKEILLPGETRLSFGAMAINNHDYVVTSDGKLKYGNKVEEPTIVFQQYKKSDLTFMYLINFDTDVSSKI